MCKKTAIKLKDPNCAHLTAQKQRRKDIEWEPLANLIYLKTLAAGDVVTVVTCNLEYVRTATVQDMKMSFENVKFGHERNVVNFQISK